MNIYQFLRRALNKLEKNIKPFNSSTALRTFAQSIITQINQILIDELPNTLNQRFEEYYLSLKEKLFNEKEEKVECIRETENKVEEPVSLEPKVKTNLSLTLDLNSFIEVIPDGWLEINDLVKMYNAYFGKNVTNINFSKLKGINEAFTKKTQITKGKKLTLYCKN